MAEPRLNKLLEQAQDAIQLKRYSFRTEETYVPWIGHNLRESEAIAPHQTPSIAPTLNRSIPAINPHHFIGVRNRLGRTPHRHFDAARVQAID